MKRFEPDLCYIGSGELSASEITSAWEAQSLTKLASQLRVTATWLLSLEAS